MSWIPTSSFLKYTVYAVVVILVVVLTVRILKLKKKHSKNEPFIMYNNFESFSNEEWEEFAQDKKVKIVLVYANWCPYCEEYLADKAKGSNKNVFDTAADKVKGVVFEKLDAAESKGNQETANSYGVQGYPTIVAARFDSTKNKYVKLATFEGNRNSVDELVSFAKEYAS